MSSPATRLGDVLNEAYELQELQSSTGELEVYLAKDKRTQSAVRVKLLRPEFALQGNVVEHFLRAPRSLSEVSHPCVPWVRIDADDTGIPFVVEETVDGRTLAGLIGSFPQGLPMAMVSQLSLPLIEALALAHQHGVVHGRIDAAHVRLVGAAHAPTPKWLGFGVSDADSAEPAQDPNYQAPERTAANTQSGPSADVFAIGVLLYTMMSGELPYRSGKKSAVPLEEISPHLPAPWVELAAECLRARPAQRPKDASAVLTRLRACIGDVTSAPVQASPPTAAVARTAARSMAAEPAAATQPLHRRTPKATVARGKGLPKPGSEPSESPSDPVPEAKVAAPAKPESPLAARVAQAMAMDQTMVSPKRAADKPASADAREPARAAEPEPTPPVDKKLAAQSAVEKLSAKHKPTKEPKERDALESSSKPAEVQGQPAQESPVAKHPAPAAAAPAVAAAGPRAAVRGARPTAAQVAAVALTTAQLDALRALRGREEEESDRWLAVFFLFLCIVALYLGVPLIGEERMTRAHAVFGAKLRIFASGFAVFACIGALRAWVVQLTDKSIVQRITTFVAFAMALCIVMLTATLYPHSARLAAVAGFARRALPWGASALFLLLALRLLLRGLRQFPGGLVQGVIALLLALASLFGAGHAVRGGLRTLHASADSQRGAAAHADEASTFDRLKQGLTEKPPLSDTLERTQDPGDIQQRKQAGAVEEEDLAIVDELGETQRRNRQVLEDVKKSVSSAPSENGTGAEAPAGSN